MNRILGLAVIAAALFVTGQANAAAIQGAGAVRCSAFLASLNSDPSAEGDAFDWAQGYLSGLNVQAEASGGAALPSLVANGFGVSEQKSFIRSYCTANPSDDFASAVDVIFFRLQRLYGLNA